jgi:endonuclease/exonuclease/phosphatase (EEP) superfamily protein YafD
MAGLQEVIHMRAPDRSWLIPSLDQAWLLRRCRLLMLLSAFGLILPTWRPLLGDPGSTLEWLADLASHWQWLYLTGLWLGSGVTIHHDRRWAWLLLLTPLPWLSATAPAAQAESDARRDAHLTIASANVSLNNQHPAALLRWLESTRPDLVVLLEVTPDYAAGLARLPAFPFRHLVPSSDAFGITLLSRHPLVQARTVSNGSDPAYIEARINWRGHPVDLIAWHPMPPISRQDAATRNRNLRRLAENAHHTGIPTVLAGDLNATPWSSAFSGLGGTGLARASGLSPTWPAAGLGLFGIPIDHVLVTPHWSVVSHSVGPDIGSDHLPILVQLVKGNDSI